MAGQWGTSLGQLLRERADDGRTALTWTGSDGVQRRVSWADHVRRSAERAAWLQDRLPADGPRHIGILMENVAEFSYLLGAAALAGLTVVGLNPTRGATEVVRDARHTDCALILTEDKFLSYVSASGIPATSVDSADLWAAPVRKFTGAPIPYADATPEAEADQPFMLILTSGTTTAPKAVVCSQGKLAFQGSKAAELRGLTGDDVLYCAMPLFHSNAVILSWVPAVSLGATIALRRRFSASAFLGDVRRYGATYANYVGKPLAYILATPERPDDAANPLRQVFGNEAAPADVARFAQRFGCTVTDGFGSTEGGISFARLPATPPAALGVATADVRIVDETGAECPRAVLDADGRLLNAAEAVGEMVNFDGAGAFEGYYAHAEADHARLHDGKFWSGDLAYRDAGGNFYFAGRSGDWIRVNGENFAAAPIARAVEEWDGAVLAAAYGVPDATAGDQVMVALEARGTFDAARFAEHLAARVELPELWRPRYVRIVGALPQTATNKIVTRGLIAEAWQCEDPVYVRDGKENSYRPMTDADRAALADEFRVHGRMNAHPAR